MSRSRVFAAALLTGMLFSAAGCMTRSWIDDAAYKDSYDWHAPHGKLYVDSAPGGAIVEIFNDEGEWVVIGSTPMSQPMALETTGKKYAIKVTKPGFYPEVVQVALDRSDVNGSHVTVPLRVDEFADPAKLLSRPLNE